MEIWKPLRNFPGYEGSTEGRIKNIRTQRVLTPTVHGKGTAKVCLQKDRTQRTVKVNRAIAETFIGECEGLDVRYKDGNPYNNRVDNLEICTHSELIRDAYARGSKRPYQNCPIRVVETGEVYESIKACAEGIGCDRSHITKYLAGKCSHVKGYHLEREKVFTHKRY